MHVHTCTQVPSGVFPSMVLLGRGLLITGGLSAAGGGAGGCGLTGACSNGLWTAVNLNSSGVDGLKSASFQGG